MPICREWRTWDSTPVKNLISFQAACGCWELDTIARLLPPRKVTCPAGPDGKTDTP